MAEFRFRLATVLRLREAARDERRADLAEAFRAEEALRRRQEALQTDLTALKAANRSSVSGGRLDIDRLLDAQRYELLLLAERQVLEAQGETVRQEIERRRLALVEADRDVRVLEKLRETQAARAAEETAAIDVKQMDEVAGRMRREDDD
jgi:flagellar export protein FliJ